MIIIKEIVSNKYKPTNDYMFGRIFGETDYKTKGILQDFLQSILTDIKIREIESIKQAHFNGNTISKKFGQMDIIAILDNNIKVNIEMQLRDFHNTIPRSLFYVEKTSIEDLKVKEDYSQISKTIGIWILDYDLFSEDDAPYHDISRLKRDFNNKVLTDKIELHYIQLPKFRKKCKHISTALDEWLTFIINDDLKEIRNMNNKKIQEAEKKLEYLNNDENAQRIAEFMADAERNEYSALHAAKAEGKKENQNQVIKNMLEKNMDIALIIEITGANKEEILKIKENL